MPEISQRIPINSYKNRNHGNYTYQSKSYSRYKEVTYIVHWNANSEFQSAEDCFKPCAIRYGLQIKNIQDDRKVTQPKF
jgi:hypothetical protein